MRVGMFTDSYFPQVSGVATSIKVLKEELEELGHEVTIFTTTDPRAIPNEPGVVRLTSIPFLSFTDRRIAITGFAKALKEAKKHQLDIIHTHTEFSMGLAGKIIGHKLNIPTIHTYHTMYEKYLHYVAKGKVLRPSNVATVSRLFCNKTSGVIVPSQVMKDKLSSYQVYKEIRVIPTGVPIPEQNPKRANALREKLGYSSDDTLLLSLSRLAFEKDLHKIILAFPEVLEKNPNAKLLFVGDGPARESLEELASSLGVSETVRFVGEIDNGDVYTFYQMADLYVNASESETQGLTYLESIANECPLVAKRNDYLSSIIKNPTMGTLYDTDASLAKAIIQALEGIEQSIPVKWHEERFEMVDEISDKKFGRTVLHFYKHVIENHYLDSEREQTKTTKKFPKLKIRLYR